MSGVHSQNPNTVGYSITSEFGGESGVGPFLIPAAAYSGDAITVSLAGVAPAKMAIGSIALPDVALPANLPSSQDVFSAAIVHQAGFPVFQLTAAPSLVWSSASDDRDALYTAFFVMRAQIETLESGENPSLLPGTTEAIVNRMAAALPLAFDEIHRFHHAFDSLHQTIELSAGMALQISWASYQYLADTADGAYNAFAATGQSAMNITRRSTLSLDFDCYSASFVPGIALQAVNAAATGSTTGAVLVGGPVDLQLRGDARRHLALVWPSEIAPPDETNFTGAIWLSCILVGADTYADLAMAVYDIVNNRNGCIQQSNGAYTVVRKFVGRSTVVPSIHTRMGSTSQLVAIGTTLRNAVQRFADPTALQMATTATGQGYDQLNLSLTRWTQGGGPHGQGQNTYSLAGIDLGGADQAIGPCGDGFDLPLLKGDVLTISTQEQALVPQVRLDADLQSAGGQEG